MSTKYVHGVDVAVYEPNVDWQALRKQEYLFAFIRATSSTSYVDPVFAEHWEGARQAGILRGAYHYLFAGQDAKVQADHFLKTVGSDKGELPPVVDLEDAFNDGVPNRKIIATCKAFLDIIEPAFGRTPIVYSRKTYLDAKVTTFGRAPGWAGNYDLWLAQYPFEFNPASFPNVNMPQQAKGWRDWKFWQYSEKAFLEGVTDEIGRPTAIDLNLFRGTKAELYAYAKVELDQVKEHVVKSGDTFSSIAEQHGVGLKELLDANPALLQQGAKLLIPGFVNLSKRDTEKPDKPIDNAGGGDTGGGDSGGGESGAAKTVHIVKSGENLSIIAHKYGTSVNAIMTANPQIINRSIIFAGQRITIP